MDESLVEVAAVEMQGLELEREAQVGDKVLILTDGDESNLRETGKTSENFDGNRHVHNLQLLQRSRLIR